MFTPKANEVVKASNLRFTDYKRVANTGINKYSDYLFEGVTRSDSPEYFQLRGHDILWDCGDIHACMNALDYKNSLG